MISRIISGLIVATTTCLIGFTSYASNEPALIKMRATAYCLEGITVSGTEVRKGICATSDRSLLGKTAIIYQRLPDNEVGEIIGIYEIQDTGCREHVIDVWFPESECQDFMNRVYEDGCQGKVWVQIIDAQG